jgi:PKD repeat protein
MSPVKVFNKAGKYKVCLTTTHANSCVSSICNVEKIDVSPASCKTNIHAAASSGNSIDFVSTTTGGQSPYQYLWNLGDGTFSNQSSFTHTYKYRGAYGVSLRVVDALGDTAYTSYNAKTLTDISSCAANYTESNIIKIAPEPALSKITVSWTDAEGTVYRSNNPLQPGNSHFEIISVAEGDRNEKGQPTKKINARFNCTLYNGNNSITINNADVVIGVAYK